VDTDEHVMAEHDDRQTSEEAALWLEGFRLPAPHVSPTIRGLPSRDEESAETKEEE
jgi:hypothetical protein